MLMLVAWVLRPRGSVTPRRNPLGVAEVNDLVAAMRVATASGLTPLAALTVGARVAAPGSAAQIPPGASLPAAIEALTLAPEVASILDGVVLSVRYGLPLTPALDRVETELAAHLRRSTEIRVRQLSVRLLFPLVLCFLPAFALVGVAPVLIAAFDF